MKCALSLNLTLKVQETKKLKLANSADPDEVAHDKPSHLDLYCLPSYL